MGLRENNRLETLGDGHGRRLACAWWRTGSVARTLLMRCQARGTRHTAV